MSVPKMCVNVPKCYWSVLSLNCYRLFKIYTSYIISKCRSGKMINTPFLGPAFIALVSPNKGLKLRAFKK